MTGRGPRPTGRSVTHGLARAFTVFVVLLVLVGATGVLGLLVSGHAREQELRQRQLREANTSMLLAMTNAETGVRGYRLSQDRDFLAPYQAGRAGFWRSAQGALDNALDDSDRRLLHAQVAVGEEWFSRYADPVAAMPPGQVVVTEAATMENKRTFDRYRALSSQLEEDARRAEASAAELESRTRTGAVVLTGLALALALALALGTQRRTLRALEEPLGAVVAEVEELTAGDRSARADDRRGPAEVRVLARSVNELADEGDRLRSERASAARVQHLGVEIGRSIRDALLDGDPLAESVTRLGTGLGVDRAYVRVLAGRVLGPIGSEWHQPHLAPLEGPAAAARDDAGAVDGIRDAYREAEPVVVADLAAVRGEDPVLDAFAERTGATAALVVPVGAGSEPLGALYLLAHSGARSWEEHEVSLAMSVAADLGRALVLARMLEQQGQLVAQLRDLDRAKTDFLSAISHELRTPLTSISGYVEMVRDGEAGAVSPGVEAMLAVVARNTTRLKSLIEDLLTLSRIESDTFRVTPGDIALAGVLHAVEQRLRPAAQAQRVVLDVAGDDGLVLRGDAVQVQRALTDLVSNAVKFTLAGGRVEVRSRAAHGWAEILVSDTGIGIPSAEQDRLFTRFFRASNATAQAIPGAGLGLTIVRSIIEHHGGELAVRSIEGEGTTVTVRLPLAVAAAPAAPASAAVAR